MVEWVSWWVSEWVGEWVGEWVKGLVAFERGQMDTISRQAYLARAVAVWANVCA